MTLFFCIIWFLLKKIVTDGLLACLVGDKSYLAILTALVLLDKN